MNGYTEWINGIIMTPNSKFYEHDLHKILKYYINISYNNNLSLYHLVKSIALLSTLLDWGLNNYSGTLKFEGISIACYMLSIDRLIDNPRSPIMNDLLLDMKITSILEKNSICEFIYKAYNEINGITTVDSIFPYASSANVVCRALDYYLRPKLMTEYAPNQYIEYIEELCSKESSESNEKIIRIPKNISVKGVIHLLGKYLL